MFKVGDIIIYSTHGLSQIDDICEKTIGNETKKYYVLHPLEQANLTISTPVDNDKVVMMKLMDKEEAEEILQSFQEAGFEWIDDARKRFNKYREIIQSGNRKNIAKLINTLLRKEHETKLVNKKPYEQDRKILQSNQSILFKELAVSLNCTYEEIEEKINQIIEEKKVGD